MTKQLKVRSIIYLSGLMLYIAAIWASNSWGISEHLKFLWFLIAYLLVGLDTFKNLRERLVQKEFLSEYTMIILATIGAFGIERYTEGVFVMILFELEMLIQTYATVFIDKEEKQVHPDAQEKKSEIETFILKFSRIYIPVMLVLVFFVMFYPPLTFSYNNWDFWVYRGVIFLIVACPTGLIASIPIAYLAGITAAGKQGIIVKGSNYLESMALADTFVFDKTGILTKGVFKVKEISPIGMTEEELLELAVYAEYHSNHPIAQSLNEAYAKCSKEIDNQKIIRMKEIPGYGVSATYDGKRIHVGNARLMEKKHVQVEMVQKTGTVIYVAVGREYAGYILIEDELRQDAKWTLHQLRDKYKSVLVMLTGDIEKAGEEAAKELKMDYIYANLLPIDKLRRVEEFLEIQGNTERVVCVGDGVDDAPILARADVGITMGTPDSAAVEAADIILMDDQLYGIIDIIRIAKETQRVVKQNIRYTFLIKIMILVLGFLGCFSMWEAIIAEIGVMIVAMLNSVLLAYYRV